MFSNFDRSELLGRDLYEKWVDAYNRVSTNIIEATSKPFYGVSQLEEVSKNPITDIRRFYVNIIDQGNKVKYFIYNLNQIKELIDKGEIKEETGYYSKTTAVRSNSISKAVYFLDTKYALTFTLDKNKGVFLK